MKRAFVDIGDGQIHYRYDGKRGETVLLLHQTPRSSDEFLKVIPLFSKKFRVLAPDTVGMGDSFKPKNKPTIEDYSKWMFKFLDNLDVDQASIVGHHTGGVIALEMAASKPERVRRLVLSNSPYVDEESRRRMKTRPPLDEFEIKEDGSHLIDLWNRRRAFYPKNRPDLLHRLLIDTLKAGEIAEEGHRAVARYKMEKRIGRVRCPTLVICGSKDNFARPHVEKLLANLKHSEGKIISGGMVPMPDQMPEIFAKSIEPFLLKENI